MSQSTIRTLHKREYKTKFNINRSSIVVSALNHQNKRKEKSTSVCYRRLPRELELALGVFGCESHIVEEAEAAALGWLCVMSRRPEFNKNAYEYTPVLVYSHDYVLNTTLMRYARKLESRAAVIGYRVLNTERVQSRCARVPRARRRPPRGGSRTRAARSRTSSGADRSSHRDMGDRAPGRWASPLARAPRCSPRREADPTPRAWRVDSIVYNREAQLIIQLGLLHTACT